VPENPSFQVKSKTLKDIRQMVMDIHLKTILCAVDFSQFTNQTLHYGVGLSKSFGARLLVFHSVNIPEDQLFTSPIAEHEQELQWLYEQALKKIEKIMESYEVDWSPAVTKGDPVNKVEELAEQEDVDLVMAASHGISGLKRFLMGTVIERMARGLSRPFLVIRPKMHFNPSQDTLRFTFGKVVVGCDISPDISPALEYARYFAEKFNSEIHLVHTMESPVHEDIVDNTQGHYDEVQQILIQRLRDRLLSLYPNKADGGHNVRAVIETGIPGESLVRYSKEHAMDLMVVGIRRHGTIEKLLVGSTTEAVLRRSPCPVLVVSPNVATSKLST
jgi:nucleotide-binding universal stress UspA family protein